MSDPRPDDGPLFVATWTDLLGPTDEVAPGATESSTEPSAEAHDPTDSTAG